MARPRCPSPRLSTDLPETRTTMRDPVRRQKPSLVASCPKDPGEDPHVQSRDDRGCGLWSPTSGLPRVEEGWGGTAALLALSMYTDCTWCASSLHTFCVHLSTEERRDARRDDSRATHTPGKKPTIHCCKVFWPHFGCMSPSQQRDEPPSSAPTWTAAGIRTRLLHPRPALLVG